MIDRFPNSDWREDFPELDEDTEKFIEKLNDRITQLQQELDKYKLVKSGEVGLCCTGFEDSLAGVFMTVHENGCFKEIGLNDFLTEKQAIELENKEIAFYIKGIRKE